MVFILKYSFEVIPDHSFFSLIVSAFLVGVQHIRRRRGQYKLDTVYKMNFRVLTMTLKVVLAFSGLLVAQLCNPMGCSLPGFSIHEFSRQEDWSGL